MGDVNWIKITTNLFEDEKIDYIESMPEADTILMIWVRLLTMAGKSNMGGYILLTEKIPYTDEMLAHKFKRQLNTVKFALQTFAKLDMIAFDDEGMRIANWDKHQNVQGLEKIREQNKIRKQRQRLTHKQQLAVGQVTEGHVTVTEESRPLSIIDKELEIDKEIRISIVRDLTAGDSLGDHLQATEGAQQPAKEKYKYSEEQMDLAEHLQKCMLENKPDMKRLSSLGQWANTIRLMIERDKRELKQIAAVIDWCQKDKFWKTNILSADTLREKFDRLELQMTESLKSKHGIKTRQYRGELLSPQIAWEEVYHKLIINKEKGIQWSSDVIAQAVKRVGYMTLLQNGAACMPAFIREYNEVMGNG